MGGREYTLERLCWGASPLLFPYGMSPPQDGPPNTRGVLPVISLPTFTDFSDFLGRIWITAFARLLFYVTTVFFSEIVPRRNQIIKEVARVGRKPAVVLSGLMEASYPRFFIGQGFESRRALLENVKLGKFILIRLQAPREWKNRTRLDEYYFFYYLIPPEDII